MSQDAPIHFLAPATVDLHLDSCGLLEGKVEGADESSLLARALFPFSRPCKYVELRREDDELVGFIQNLAELPDAVREALEKAIHLRHFVPEIRRIIAIDGRHHMYTWRVVTDRGEAEFHIRGRRQHVEEIGGNGYVVTDNDGNRYRIPPVTQLDARSLLQLRKIL